MPNSSNGPIALVVGLCSHGLAMTRALHQCGIEVHAFEANPNLPGALTNSAKVHLIKNIKTDSLVDDLLRFRQQFDADRKIVLFPTNDNNVKVIACHVEQLSSHYEISWGHCADKVLALLMKSNIEARCKETGLNYPQSYVMNSAQDIVEIEKRFEFPIIAKPVQPQSGFKALRCDNVEQLKRLVDTYHDDLPLLIQHWITGTDVDIYFGALYLDKGEVVARFTGNKLESFPPAMGQTTVAITSDHPEVLPLTETFFDGLQMSGPVSLELKRDDKGRFWVIEPTIGRTDFWAGLCVAAGCNLLEMEFQHCTGQVIDSSDSFKPTIWFDSERDVTAFPRHLAKSLPGKQDRLSPTFSYLTTDDMQPFFRAFRQAAGKISRSLMSRISSKSAVAQSAHTDSIEVFDSLDALPIGFRELLDNASVECIFNGTQWYQNFCHHVAEKDGNVKLLCLSSEQGEAMAILPMLQFKQRHLGMNFNYLTSLTNYYSPMYKVLVDQACISQSAASQRFFEYLRQNVSQWDVIDIHPISEESEDAIRQAAQAYGLVTHNYVVTKNWFERVPDGFESYLAQIPSRTKNTIKRKSNKLNKMGDWHIHLYQDETDLIKGIADYDDVYRNSWKPTEPYPEFVSGLIRVAAQNGWLRLGILYIEQEPVAAQLWLHGNGKAYIYKLAYKDSARQYSPGSILTAHMMENAVDTEQIDYIDFLTGKDEFKKDWMNCSRDLLGIQIGNKSNVKSMVFAFKNSLSEARSRLRDAMK